MEKLVSKPILISLILVLTLVSPMTVLGMKCNSMNALSGIDSEYKISRLVSKGVNLDLIRFEVIVSSKTKKPVSVSLWYENDEFPALSVDLIHSSLERESPNVLPVTSRILGLTKTGEPLQGTGLGMLTYLAISKILYEEYNLNFTSNTLYVDRDFRGVSEEAQAMWDRLAILGYAQRSDSLNKYLFRFDSLNEGRFIELHEFLSENGRVIYTDVDTDIRRSQI